VDFTQWIALAVVQAMAEMLPIGAAAQFAWLHALFGLPEGGPATVPGLGVGIRLGLMLGIAAFFWEDMADMARGLVRAAKGKRDPGARLFAQLVFATVPSIALGIAIERELGTAWHTPQLLAWCAVGVGVVLLMFDRACMTVKRIEHAGYGDVLLLGLAHAAGFVPGVGRIAAAIAMARLLGYERPDAARFSLLIWIPVLAAGAGWQGARLVLGPAPFPTAAVLVGFACAFVLGIALVALLMGWLRRRTLLPIVLYRLVIALTLLVLAYEII
jgi:undecaprenyl-diphosphatase